MDNILKMIKIRNKKTRSKLNVIILYIDTLEHFKHYFTDTYCYNTMKLINLYDSDINVVAVVNS